MKDFDPNPPAPDSDPTRQLIDDMAQVGLDPKTILWDGRIHRFPGANKPRGTDAWYYAFPDRRGAKFGDWSAGIDEHWFLKRKEPFTKAEKDRWAKEKRKRDREQAEKRAAAIEQVKKVWKAAEKPSPEKRPHPYLFNKDIYDAPNLRISTLTHLDKETNYHIPAGLLLVPMYKRGQLVNVLRIWPNGQKRTWPKAETIGARHLIAGDSTNWDLVYVCEGWATGWTVHQATGCPVVVAFTAPNLPTVARALHKKRPESKIIIASDNDRWSKMVAEDGEIPNPGLYWAKRAAEEAEAELVIPDFDDLAGNPTDFDELRQREGIKQVTKWLDPDKADDATTEVARTEGEDDEDEAPDRWITEATFRCLGANDATY